MQFTYHEGIGESWVADVMPDSCDVEGEEVHIRESRGMRAL